MGNIKRIEFGEFNRITAIEFDSDTGLRELIIIMLTFKMFNVKDATHHAKRFHLDLSVYDYPVQDELKNGIAEITSH